MSKFIGILSAILGLLGLVIVGLMFVIAVGAGMGGHSTGTGMTMVLFQLWGAIFCMAGIALGFIAFMMSKGVNGAARKGGKMGIACGLLGVVSLFIGLQFF